MEMFKIGSTHAIITDPCYNRNSHCRIVQYVQTGTWKAHVIGDVDGLLFTHADYDTLNKDYRFVGVAGVDSGQIGMFDWVKYPRVSEGYENVEGLYRQICDKYIYGKIANMKFGAVSSTKYGDGGYAVHARRKGGKTIGICVRFNSLDGKWELS